MSLNVMNALLLYADRSQPGAFFIPLAHGVFGPFDELLPFVLIAVLAGLLAFTWWNGRHAPLPDDEDDSLSTAEGSTADQVEIAPTPVIQPSDKATPGSAEPAAEDAHFTLK